MAKKQFISTKKQLEMGFWISRNKISGQLEVYVPELSDTAHLERTLNNYLNPKVAAEQHQIAVQELLAMGPTKWMEQQPLVKAIRAELDKRATEEAKPED